MMQNWIDKVFKKLLDGFYTLNFSEFKKKYQLNYDLIHQELNINNDEPQLPATSMDGSLIQEHVLEVKDFCEQMDLTPQMGQEFLESNCYILLTTLAAFFGLSLDVYLAQLFEY